VWPIVHQLLSHVDICETAAAIPRYSPSADLDCAYRLDLLVEKQVVVELKTAAALDPVHFAQMMTYLTLSGCEVGLLINFNVAKLTEGLRRVVRNYQEPSASSRPPRPSAIESV
jgi:GxxExxY protein